MDFFFTIVLFISERQFFDYCAIFFLRNPNEISLGVGPLGNPHFGEGKLA
jgi:hypothetical protein